MPKPGPWDSWRNGQKRGQPDNYNPRKRAQKQQEFVDLCNQAALTVDVVNKLKHLVPEVRIAADSEPACPNYKGLQKLCDLLGSDINAAKTPQFSNLIATIIHHYGWSGATLKLQLFLLGHLDHLMVHAMGNIVFSAMALSCHDFLNSLVDLFLCGAEPLKAVKKDNTCALRALLFCTTYREVWMKANCKELYDEVVTRREKVCPKKEE